MAVIKIEDVAGVQLGEETICSDCMTEEELQNAKLDELIEAEEGSDELLFCDRCKERMN